MQKGFTLAEVLITLAIIGIVAALTIPSLANGYQKRVLTTQLQKAYAEISQAGAMVMANEMGSDFRRSKAIKDMNFVGKYLSSGGGSGFASSYGYHDNPNANYNIYTEINGGPKGYSCGSTKSGAAFCVNEYAVGILDVNGDKGPNLIGRDAFTIGFKPDGSIQSDYSVSLESIIWNDWNLDKPNW